MMLNVACIIIAMLYVQGTVQERHVTPVHRKDRVLVSVFSQLRNQNLERKKKDLVFFAVLCRIVPSGSVPHRYRNNLNFDCGSLRFDVVYNLDKVSKNVFKKIVCMLLIRNVITLLRIFILLGPHRQNWSVSGTESVGTILHNTLNACIGIYCKIWGWLLQYSEAGAD